MEDIDKFFELSDLKVRDGDRELPLTGVLIAAMYELKIPKRQHTGVVFGYITGIYDMFESELYRTMPKGLCLFQLQHTLDNGRVLRAEQILEYGFIHLGCQQPERLRALMAIEIEQYYLAHEEAMINRTMTPTVQAIWAKNPLLGLRQLAKRQGIEPMLEKTILSISDWTTIEPNSCLNDMLDQIRAQTGLCASFDANRDCYKVEIDSRINLNLNVEKHAIANAIHAKNKTRPKRPKTEKGVY